MNLVPIYTLGDVDHEGIKRFISSLQSQVEECMFPHLELNDIVWDPEIEDCTLHVCDDEIIDDQDECTYVVLELCICMCYSRLNIGIM